MFYLFILPIYAIDDIQVRRSIICGCKHLSPSECIEVEWCELASQFDKCPMDADCITYQTELECEEANASQCVWLDNYCLNKCELLEFNTCQNKQIDSNCSQFNTSTTCETYSWCEFNTTTQVCQQILQVSCNDILNSIECEEYGCQWDDVKFCQNKDSDCSQFETIEDCMTQFQENRQCIWIEGKQQVSNIKSSCFQSKECDKYTYDNNELDICESISNCKVDENQCQSCVQDMFTFESILQLISIFYLF
ncbi:unnamed protein product [Paramecium primaurelia]|uniref:Uncharacterized protein n=1 Tax=Paramecium primaurelia TaxID=5886 RepID=A0A8S1K159_PARPR|nr:unnamed protein product [Paramecium primaurelia]